MVYVCFVCLFVCSFVLVFRWFRWLPSNTNDYCSFHILSLCFDIVVSIIVTYCKRSNAEETTTLNFWDLCIWFNFFKCMIKYGARIRYVYIYSGSAVTKSFTPLNLFSTEIVVRIGTWFWGQSSNLRLSIDLRTIGDGGADFGYSNA